MSSAGPSQAASSAPSGGSVAAGAASVMGTMSSAGPSQAAHSAPSGGSVAAGAASVGAL